MKRLRSQNLVFYLLAIFISIGLKYHYSKAESGQLDWILKPTSIFVGSVCNLEFEKEVNNGYVNREKKILIAPACAGVNFLIISVLMMIFSFIHMIISNRIKLYWMIGSLFFSYVLTLVANTIRITFSVYLFQLNIYSEWLTKQRLHLVIGIFCYFFFLCFLHFLGGFTANKISPPKNIQRRRALTLRRKMNYIFKNFAPFFWYFFIVLMVPLANYTNFKTGRFNMEFVMLVCLICPTVFILFFLIQYGVKRIMIFKWTNRAMRVLKQNQSMARNVSGLLKKNCESTQG